MIDPQRIFRFQLEAAEAGGQQASWLVPKQCPYMDGHFPDQPVLPAIGLIDGSLEFLRLAGARVDPEKLTLKRAKFTALVTPGKQIKLRMRHIDHRWDVDWLDAPTGTPLASFSFHLG